MTEAEWLACADPRRMLKSLRGKTTNRKLRLLGVAIARASWDQLEDERSRRAIGLAERFADGAVGASALEAVVDDAWDVRDELWDAGPDAHDDRLWVAEVVALTASVREWNNTSFHPGPSDQYPFRLPIPGHCELIRDVFGNPFRPAAIDPAHLSTTAVTLARQVYESRDFTALLILADALQDAGCDAADVLAHCRGGGPHVRGCWVVDLLTGRE